MKPSTTWSHFILAWGLILLNFVSCTVFDDVPTPVLTRYDFPSEVLDSIFTRDIPKDIRNVDNFLDKIVRNGMAIHEGNDPPEITFNGSNSVGKKYTIEHDCIYDEKVPANVDSLYGKYEETILLSNQQNTFVADVSYFSVGHDDYPQFPSGLDRGSGTGYVSGNNNNFTIFYKVEEGNGVFDNIPYQALWIISGTVSENAREITNVTKCLVMLGKGPDPEDKIANRGTIRIFRDVNPDWIQPDVAISDFSPTEGPYDTEVTINGSGFGTVNDSVKVMFNNKEAKVLEANPNQLRVEVPKGADTGPIAVQVNDKIDSLNTFTYIKVYTVSTLAGNGKPAFLDGSGDIAMFDHPYGIAVDTDGIVYVADTGNNRIRKITPEGEVSTLTISNQGPLFQSINVDAIFNNPLGVAVDAQGNIYVADTESNRIRKITTTGFMTTLQNCTFSKGTECFTAFFNQPSGIAVDNLSNVYVADGGNNDNKEPSILKITETGIISTLTSISQSPSGVATDTQGNVYVADKGNHLIRKITPEGVISTLGGATQFNSPSGVGVDAEGNIYVADTENHQIQRITPSGEVSTLAGTGEEGILDGIGSTARFNNSTGIAIVSQDTIYVADYQNHLIRKMILE
ncbi:MAG: IPT/TIG domain-containing protein [Anditalea sp.]